MTQCRAGPHFRDVAFQNVQVCATDRRLRDAHNRIRRLRDCRFRLVFESLLARTMEYQCFHDDLHCQLRTFDVSPRTATPAVSAATAMLRATIWLCPKKVHSHGFSCAKRQGNYESDTPQPRLHLLRPRHAWSSPNERHRLRTRPQRSSAMVTPQGPLREGQCPSRRTPCRPTTRRMSSTSLN